ncbi:GNS1/SUR4 family protein [Tieghemostelium lacteum]|uniref:Elongation of fatty acids protein n=1 Tax=Tieghemostelium lacteum TaxID=361077 RepID=A0A151Z710_TIELA|nr:GNS1/SUR4 family protein [Tieghemostelium lacteum]|eukprot:KYQ89717.1 GNS1/SUR4 family protein [Tieghemostelium lacteum]
MDQIINYVDWEHLYKHSIKNSNWNELFDIQNFKFTFGVTPFSQFQIIPVVVAFYLFTIFSIKGLMKNREAFSLKWVTALHNAILCLWSLLMCVGVVYEVLKRVTTDGGLFTICEVAPGFNQGPAYYWSYIFYISKFYELFDTVIIVLKKKDLIFLHVYHHCIVVWLCWYLLYTGWSLQLWVVFLNTFVHIFMYYFYLNSALGRQVWWKKYITQIQILQFCCLGVIGVLHFICLHLFSCVTDYSAYISAYSINFSFLFLFTRFYNRSYTPSSKPGTKGSPNISTRTTSPKSKKLD